mmetsp:Transcript_53480/g.122400  ORF Transcript_53480/g.122400 Transcript_53480/m.122400 type:complete len:211 (-) Transcript_53480:282-914(-)
MLWLCLARDWVLWRSASARVFCPTCVPSSPPLSRKNKYLWDCSTSSSATIAESRCFSRSWYLRADSLTSAKTDSCSCASAYSHRGGSAPQRRRHARQHRRLTTSVRGTRTTQVTSFHPIAVGLWNLFSTRTTSIVGCLSSSRSPLSKSSQDEYTNAILATSITRKNSPLYLASAFCQTRSSSFAPGSTHRAARQLRYREWWSHSMLREQT